MSKPSCYSLVPSITCNKPVLINEIAAGPGRLEIEIGFGRGKFLLEMAKFNPNTNYVGLETKKKLVHIVKNRSIKHSLKNVRVYYGDARDIFKAIVPKGIVSRIFVNFPDPWWKKRHLKRLVLTDEFLKNSVQLLKPNGEIFIQTDVDFRARAYLELLRTTKNLEPAGNGFIKNNPYQGKSTRELRCNETGLEIFRMLFVKKP